MEKLYWETANNVKINIKDMNTNHILNTLKLLHGNGKQEFSDIWNGKTKEEWIIIFNDEIDYRRINKK